MSVVENNWWKYAEKWCALMFGDCLKRHLCIFAAKITLGGPEAILDGPRVLETKTEYHKTHRNCKGAREEVIATLR